MEGVGITSNSTELEARHRVMLTRQNTLSYIKYVMNAGVGVVDQNVLPVIKRADLLARVLLHIRSDATRYLLYIIVYII